MKMKYVIIDDNLPVIFHSGLTHSDVARGLGEVTSAGFCDIYAGLDEGGGEEVSVSCYGDSFSLKIKSKPEDSILICTMINSYF